MIWGVAGVTDKTYAWKFLVKQTVELGQIPSHEYPLDREIKCALK